MNALNRKQNDLNPSRRLRGSFSSRRRRHDPWLVFNMFTFTFEGQRSTTSTGLPVTKAYCVSWAFAPLTGAKKCVEIHNLRAATLNHPWKG